MTENPTVKSRLDEFDSKVRELAIRENEAAFAMYRGLEHEDLNKIEAESAALWREDGTVELGEAAPPSPEFERPLFIIQNGILRNKVEGIEEIFTAKNECNKIVVEFKPELDGEEISRSDLGELMRWDPDAAKRQRAAAVYRPLEEKLHEKVLNLINLRNTAAKDLGFPSFAHLAFQLNELDLGEVTSQLESFLEKGADGFKATLDKYKDRDEVTPGGLLSSDLSFLHDNFLPNIPTEKFPKDKMLEVLTGEYGSVGINLDELPIKTVIQDIPAGGFCFSFDPGKDVRILANPRDGQMWYQVLFHEFGHAVQGSFAKGDGHYLVALSDPGFFWESIAVLFEKLALRKRFLKNYADDAQIENFMEGALGRLSHRIRGLAAGSLFEYSLYLEPAPYEELCQRRADMFRRHLFVEPAVEPPTFTHDIFHITHPCYLQNYVLAELVAAQLLEASDSSNGDPWTEKFTKRVVDDLLVPGGMVSWREKIEKFTGKPLSPDALLRELYPS